MKKLTFLLLGFMLHLYAFAQTTETEQQKKMAAQMAKYMDAAWEASPESGKANLRILMLENDKPMAGKVSIYGAFALLIKGRYNHTTAFNPNANGRYVYEGITPGTYNILIEGKDGRQGFKWEKPGVKINVGESPVLEVKVE